MNAVLSAGVEVLEIRPAKPGGSLRATAKAKIGPWILHEIRIIQQEGQKAWISLPQREGSPDPSSGKRRWFPLIELDDKELLRAIQTAVLTAWGRSGSI